MTLPEIREVIQDRGLDAALDEVHLHEVPEDLQFAWGTAVMGRAGYDHRKSVIMEFLERSKP